MLRDFSDRPPEPPTGRNVVAWTAIGVVGGLMALNVVRGIMERGWNW